MHNAIRKRHCLFLGRASSVLLLTIALAACGGGDASPAAGSIAQAKLPPDIPFDDKTVYGGGPGDSIPVESAQEEAAVTHHRIDLNGQSIQYTATAGHLVTVDAKTSQPNAKMFYVAYTVDGKEPGSRPVTFLYNGGPGSSAVTLLLGSYGPKRIDMPFPSYAPPPPYRMLENRQSLLDKTDLVFINPVGTGFSVAVAPANSMPASDNVSEWASNLGISAIESNYNRKFWSVQADAQSIVAFITRYLALTGRWNSPRFLFGESYGGPRTAVTSYLMQDAGVNLNGVVLLSPILDFRSLEDGAGAIPTLAAIARYHNKATAENQAKDLSTYMAEARLFAANAYRPLQLSASVGPDDNLLQRILKFGGTAGADAVAYKLNSYLGMQNDSDFEAAVARFNFALGKAGEEYYRSQLEALTSVDRMAFVNGIELIVPAQSWFFKVGLLAAESLRIGSYDGRVTGIAAGIGSELGTDPTFSAMQGAYTTAWRLHLANDLKYTSRSNYLNRNYDANRGWDWSHVSPNGVYTQSREELNTTPDLAATMTLNPAMKVLALSGYYDTVTPFYRTELDLQNLNIADSLRKSITVRNYPSGHMLYLDNGSREASKSDLAGFYDGAVHP